MTADAYSLISVIVPIYNVDRYLRRCLDSIADQTYENLEIFLVDDGSSDESPAICDAYAAKDSRFRVIHRPNGGISAARNMGLDAMRGEFVSLVDGDDYLAPTMLEALYARMVADGTPLAICNMLRVDEQGAEIPGLRWELGDAVWDEKTFWKNCFAKLDVVCVMPSNKLYRSGLFEGVRFEPGRLHEDEFILHKIVGQCERISCVSDRLYYYVMREGSLTSRSAFSIRHLDGAAALIDRAFYLQGKGYQSLAETCLMNCSLIFSRVEKFLPNMSKAERERYARSRREFREARGKMLRGGASARFFWYSLLLLAGVRFHSAARTLFPKGMRCVRALRRGGFRPLMRAIRKKLPYARMRMKVAYIHRFGAHRRCICFLSTPMHGNLGDQAIVYAQHRLVSDMGLGRNIVEIQDGHYRRWKRSLERVLSPRDVLVICGGGNIGTIWLDEEAKMRDIVQRFPRNPIFIFPQTAYFSDEEAGRAEFEKTVQIHGAHARLRIYCRDARTHRLFGGAFGDRAALTPDIAPYIAEAGEEAARTEALLCLREDCERTIGPGEEARLEAYLRSLGLPFRRGSMLVPGAVTAENREGELRKKWREFSGAKIVVTDRLHGMIFAAITGTPCVALDNMSRKLRGGHFWLQHLPYIRFCESVDEVPEAARQVLSAAPQRYDRAHLEPYYDMIKEDLRRALE